MSQPKIRSLQLGSDFLKITGRAFGAPIVIDNPSSGEVLTYSESAWRNLPQTILVEKDVTPETFTLAGDVSLNLNDISQGNDESIWLVGTTESNFIIATRTDVDGTGNNALVINRTGATVDSITLSSSLISLANGTGTSSAIQLQSNTPTLLWNDLDAVANESVWDITTSASSALEFRTRTDSHGTGTTWMQVIRSGTKVTKINLDAISVTINDNKVLTSNDIPSIIQTVVEQVLAQLNATST